MEATKTARKREDYDSKTQTLSVGIWEYSLTEVPDRDSDFVVDTMADILQNISLHKLVNDLDIAKDLIQLAYNSSVAQELAVNVSDRQIALRDITAKSLEFITEIKNETEDCLDNLVDGFKMLLNGKEKKAINEFNKVNKVAVRLKRGCEELEEDYREFADRIKDDGNFVEKKRAGSKAELDDFIKKSEALKVRLDVKISSQKQLAADLEDLMEDLDMAKTEAADESTKAFVLELFGGLFKAAASIFGAYAEAKNPAMMINKVVSKVDDISTAAKQADQKAPAINNFLEDFRAKFSEKEEARTQFKAAKSAWKAAKKALTEAEKNGGDASAIQKAKDLVTQKEGDKNAKEAAFNNAETTATAARKKLNEALQDVGYLPKEVNENVEKIKAAAEVKDKKEEQLAEAEKKLDKASETIEKLEEGKKEIKDKGSLSGEDEKQLKKIEKDLNTAKVEETDAEKEKTEKEVAVENAQTDWEATKIHLKAAKEGLQALGSSMSKLADQSNSRAESARALFRDLLAAKRDLQKERRKLAEEVGMLNGEISANASSQELAKRTIQLYTISLWALRNLMMTLKDAEQFWHNLAKAFDKLKEQKIQNEIDEIIDSVKGKKKRIKLYQEESFARIGIDILVQWKALNVIADKYRKETDQIDQEVAKNIRNVLSLDQSLNGLQKMKEEVQKRITQVSDEAGEMQKVYEAQLAEQGSN